MRMGPGRSNRSGRQRLRRSQVSESEESNDAGREALELGKPSQKRNRGEHNGQTSFHATHISILPAVRKGGLTSDWFPEM